MPVSHPVSKYTETHFLHVGIDLLVNHRVISIKHSDCVVCKPNFLTAKDITLLISNIADISPPPLPPLRLYMKENMKFNVEYCTAAQK